MNKLFESINDLESYTLAEKQFEKVLEVTSISFYSEAENFETVFPNIDGFNTFSLFDPEITIGYLYVKENGFLLEDFLKVDGRVYLLVNYSNADSDKWELTWCSALQEIEGGFLLLFAGVKQADSETVRL